MVEEPGLRPYLRKGNRADTYTGVYRKFTINTMFYNKSLLYSKYSFSLYTPSNYRCKSPGESSGPSNVPILFL